MSLRLETFAQHLLPKHDETKGIAFPQWRCHDNILANSLMGLLR